MNETCRSLARAFAAPGLAALIAACAVLETPAPDYAAIVAAPDRSEADRVNDKRRKPVELYGFTGARPGMKVLDMGAGGGYSTELLARAVAPGGTVYSQSPADMFPGARKAYAARAESAAMKNAVRLERPFEDPLPPGVGPVDLITFFFFYHDTVWLGVDRARMNRQLYGALKPGGLLILADHSARPGDGDTVTKSLHRIEESVVRRELEAAGFQLVAEGTFLRNPADARDTHVNKNTVPNDEFVLKFRKPQ
jgi:predicted methyltransferase